ncbi:hypothetical protein PR202_ga06140 [Eleusine coracana subsp. coracana]|uniref:1-phosphatidylinositol 4-kinase n=1 Tax=Eleusine coracana subsp. coracana TaxID=191504 RepID=A0AAV5BWF9_ELECO|nr:hypothetical protein PR202_ga06140 [Eleusine coracana subsp. coracana]
MNYNNTGFFFFFRHQHDDDDNDDDDDDEFNKLGSLQAFVNNCGSCEDMGPRAFPVQEVHKISVLDMRLANADRHAGNILVSKDDHGVVSLVPIDHGYCLPESFEDCTFEWLYWPQSREPFNNETVEYVASLDAEEDIAILKLHGWDISRECAWTLRVATMLLKKGVERGLTAFHIGSLMCRETLTKESTIEEILRQAQQQNGAADEEDAFFRTVAEIMDRRLHQLSSHTADQSGEHRLLFLTNNNYDEQSSSSSSRRTASHYVLSLGAAQAQSSLAAPIFTGCTILTCTEPTRSWHLTPSRVRNHDNVVNVRLFLLETYGMLSILMDPGCSRTTIQIPTPAAGRDASVSTNTSCRPLQDGP